MTCCRVKTCCFCIDHVEGVKALGIAYFVVNVLLCLEQIIVTSPWGIVIQLILAVSSLSLIYGALKRSRFFILVWILSYLLALMFLLAYELYSAISEQNGLYAIIIVITVPVIIYSLIVVGSLHRRLGDPQDSISGYETV